MLKAFIKVGDLMKKLVLESRQSFFEIDLLRGVVVRLECGGKNLCKDNSFPLFNILMVGENYDKWEISAFDCNFEKVEIVDGVMKLYVAQNANYASGVVRLQIQQYAANGDIISCGTLNVFTIEK
jgi:hypothetical protein